MKRSRRLPAEWEPQDGVLLAWPHALTDWAEDLRTVEPVFIELARAITRHEQVVIVAPEVDALRARLQQENIDLARVTLVPVRTNDTWARDFGPLCVEA